MTSSIRTFVHSSPEENLLEAKRSVRKLSRAHLHRILNLGDDIIEVRCGTDVLERHVCHTGIMPARTGSRFCVEEMALYR